MRPGADALTRGVAALGEERFDLAADIFAEGARAGHTGCMLHLGNLMDDVLEPRQPGRARHWYLRAYRLGESAGAYNLAIHYAGRRERRWFLFWMQKTAAMGMRAAIEELARARADPAYLTDVGDW